MPDFASPFLVGGPCIAVLGSFGSPISATSINMTGPFSLFAYNRSGTQDAYLAYGASSGAVASAVIPVTGLNPSGNTQNVLPLPKGSVQTFTFQGPTFVAALVPATNAVIDLVTGEGE